MLPIMKNNSGMQIIAANSAYPQCKCMTCKKGTYLLSLFPRCLSVCQMLWASLLKKLSSSCGLVVLLYDFSTLLHNYFLCPTGPTITCLYTSTMGHISMTHDSFPSPPSKTPTTPPVIDAREFITDCTSLSVHYLLQYILELVFRGAVKDFVSTIPVSITNHNN